MGKFPEKAAPLLGKMAVKIDSFKQLLNEISHELTERNLQSVIHLSNIPGAVQSNIKEGHQLFNYLIHDGKISADDVAHLRDLLRKMRPRRRGLVQKVDEYIKCKHNVDDVSHILGDLSESYEGRPPSVLVKDDSPVNSKALFKFDCAYMNCVCHKFPSCSIPLIILIVIAVIFTAIFWYGDVPKVSKYINSDEDLRKAGLYIILVESTILLLLLGYVLWKRFSRGRYGYKHFINNSIQEQLSPPNPPYSSSTESGELRKQFKTSQPRVYRSSTSNYGSYSGAESAPGYSYASGHENFSTDEAP